jgi:hypothetical protein
MFCRPHLNLMSRQKIDFHRLTHLSIIVLTQDLAFVGKLGVEDLAAMNLANVIFDCIVLLNCFPKKTHQNYVQ